MSIHDMDLFNGLEKWEIAIRRIQMFRGPLYVAFSGGKDSVVILDLVKKSGVPYDAHYHVTGVDPPELVKFVRTFKDVQFHIPAKSIWKLIRENGILPTRVMRYCCRLLKEQGGADRKIVTGVRWAESARRKKRQMVEHCLDHSQGDKQFIHPIIDWNDGEVWEYIEHFNLQYCQLYDEGYARLGCLLCPMGGKEQRIRQMERWPRISALWERAAQRCFDERVKNGKPFHTWQTGKEFFDWWIYGEDQEKDNPDQSVLFE